MKRRIVLEPRKSPQQARSHRMREYILSAAVRVLKKEGALRFTTPRVAEAAGVSIGSLYQYFPNKHALVYALHARIVELAWIEVRRILDHRRYTPRDKLRRIASMFFVQESADVAEMGAALQDAEIFFADQPEHRALNEQVLDRFILFVRQVLPGLSAAEARFRAQLIVVSFESIGKAIASMSLSNRELRRWARACADMLAEQVGFSLASNLPKMDAHSS